ncbi:MAG: hypothetical protein A3I11_00655 [Elusimicrobia bacterium RIFCSPLOWO2_02_FULL_39_32]|nr:MAG: hypothetical protein A2034_00135 [Elusimicrobia bacterium GWA2_38_7]OGR78957.1 MAG: hypothetical protein A3B80_07680 [Elusimicrobia bacterium RIFCSPHIGHO2_02_FULL_39_36]OGR92541.1 MAG: hypothetical protein A3I11_00655 [Elusimicrobia bacterium RIFCSPLOWO2_02_FULL_39_32]
MIILIIILLLSPFLVLMTHKLLLRSLKNQSPQIVAINAGIFSTIPLFFLIWLLLSNHSSFSNENIYWGLIYSFIIYGGIIYSYYHLFNMSETGRRIKIICTILANGSLSKKSIIDIYGTANPIEIRLERLLHAKILSLKNDYYILNKKFLYWTSSLVENWRKFLGF